MSGYGTLLKESGTTVAEVLTITGPSPRGTIDEILPNPEISMSLKGNPHLPRLQKLYKDRSAGDFTLLFADEDKTAYFFRAYVTEVIEGLESEATFYVSGQTTVGKWSYLGDMWRRFKHRIRGKIYKLLT